LHIDGPQVPDDWGWRIIKCGGVVCFDAHLTLMVTSAKFLNVSLSGQLIADRAKAMAQAGADNKHRAGYCAGALSAVLLHIMDCFVMLAAMLDGGCCAIGCATMLSICVTLRNDEVGRRAINSSQPCDDMTFRDLSVLSAC
jgi:hypothetical protein